MLSSASMWEGPGIFFCTTKRSSQSCLAGTVTIWATTFAPTVTMVIFVSFLPVWRSDGILSHGRPEVVYSASCEQHRWQLDPTCITSVCVYLSKTLHDKQSTAYTTSVCFRILTWICTKCISTTDAFEINPWSWFWPKNSLCQVTEKHQNHGIYRNIKDPHMHSLFG